MAFVHRLFFSLAYPLRSIYLVFFTQNNLSAQHKLFTPFYVLMTAVTPSLAKCWQYLPHCRTTCPRSSTTPASSTVQK